MGSGGRRPPVHRSGRSREVRLRKQGGGERRNDNDADDRVASFQRETHGLGAESAAEPHPRIRLRELLARALPDASTNTIETLVETARLRDVASGDVLIRQGGMLPLTLVIDGY